MQDGTETGQARVDLAAAVRGTAVAVGVAALGAVAVAVAPLLGVATAADGSQRGGQPAAAVAVALALAAVPLLALWLLRAGRLAGAVGVLSGAGAVATGLAVLDVQLFARALDANRLELVRPVTAAELGPGAGAAAVLAGHVLLVVAALVGLVVLRRSGVLDDPDVLGDAAGEGPVLRRSAPLVCVLAAVAAVVLAGGVFLAPLRSSDPVVLVPAVAQSPVAVLVGTAVVAVAVLVALALALVSTSVATASGALAGVALAALSLAAPRLLAGALDPRFRVGPGAVLATIGSVGLAACATGLVVTARRRAERAPAGRAPVGPGLPGVRALHLVVAVAAVLAGLAAVLAAVVPLLSTTGGLVAPEVDSVRVLLAAGVVLAAVGVAMLAGFGPALRPVAGAGWAGVLVAGGAVLQAVLVATDVAGAGPAGGAATGDGTQPPGVGWGAGAVLTVLALVLAVVCAAAAGLAGAAERDEVDTSQDVDPPRPVVVAAGVAALAAALALALPLYTAAGFTAAGITAGDPLAGGWGWDTWSLLVAAVVVVAALAVAVRARRERGPAVLAGAGLVLVVHLSSWPLTSGRVPGAAAGPGALLSLLALVALGVTALLLARRAPSNADGAAPTRARSPGADRGRARR